MPTPDDFQLRLVQWLLDQFNSRKELDTATQQITLLISQSQKQSLGDLYIHIGAIIFQRAARKGPKSCIQPCVELCHSLCVAHFKQHLDLSPRISLIHDHILRLCMASVRTENTLSKDNGIPVERSSELLFNLWEFQLVNIVQICEYIFRVIEAHKTSVGRKLTDAVAGVRFLLRSCFPNHSYGHWENEVNSFHQWVNSCSNSNENESNTIRVSAPDQISETNVDYTATEHTSHSPSKFNAEDAFFSTDDAVPPEETSHLPQSSVHDEETMDNTTKNNLGKHPESPSALVAKLFEDVRSRKGAPIDGTAGMEHRRASSIVFSALEDARGQPAKDTKGVKPAPTPSSSAATTPARTSTLPSAAATPSGTAPIPGKPKKGNVHVLFNSHAPRSTLPSPSTSALSQSGSVPPVTTTRPTATMSRATAPAQASADSNKPRRGSSTSGGQRTAGSPRMSANTPRHPHDHPGHPNHALPQWRPAGYYYPPHDYNPYMYWGALQRQYPQYRYPYTPPIDQRQKQSSSRTQGSQPRPPSAPPVPNNAPPDCPVIKTSLHAPPNAPSPSLNAKPFTFVPGSLRRPENHVPPTLSKVASRHSQPKPSLGRTNRQASGNETSADDDQIRTAQRLVVGRPQNRKHCLIIALHCNSIQGVELTQGYGFYRPISDYTNIMIHWCTCGVSKLARSKPTKLVSSQALDPDRFGVIFGPRTSACSCHTLHNHNRPPFHSKPSSITKTSKVGCTSNSEDDAADTWVSFLVLATIPSYVSASRHDDFQFRLVQWLLDQLNSRKELGGVTQQITLLISQAQEQSIEDFYSHIGVLIFQKAVQFPLGGSESCTPLLAELCCSLSVIHFNQHPSPSPRVILVHDHIFRLCIESIFTENAVEPANAMSSRRVDGISVEKSSEILFNLWDFQLASIVQVCEYIFRVIEAHERSVGPKLADAVAGVRFLLRSCFSNRSRGPWKREAESFREWADAHSNGNKHQTNTARESSSSQAKQAHIPKAKDIVIHHRGISSSSDGNSDLPANSLNRPDPSKSALSQSQTDGEEEISDAGENNIGRPPGTPSRPPAKSVVDAHSSKRSVPISVMTNMDYRPASSIGFANQTTVEDEPPFNGFRMTASTPVSPASHSTTSTGASGVPVVAATPPITAPAPGNPRKPNVASFFQDVNPPSVPVTSHGPYQRPPLPSPSSQRPPGSPRMGANMPLRYPMQPPHQWGPAQYYPLPPSPYYPYNSWEGQPSQRSSMLQPYPPPVLPHLYYYPPVQSRPPSLIVPSSDSHQQSSPIASTSPHGPPSEPPALGISTATLRSTINPNRLSTLYGEPMTLEGQTPMSAKSTTATSPTRPNATSRTETKQEKKEGLVKGTEEPVKATKEKEHAKRAKDDTDPARRSSKPNKRGDKGQGIGGGREK
ncbi:unnamed protein product [Rhizoctonia solani]|uniref:Uncharacterized protein n=1 Tax=Rhizoctonia solani TaxID=456999 RepID=A0A8H3GE08_9AGAM|nr:unnamed protein product [Rhizoctonia solani]